ncbi:bis(5'-nucleosyl)-tetraphosphatase (symmetrical) YqeK [Shouchella lehensis]|uniref:bis(5'-nucleosyl)-tetraphosphatase (symmetrical) n=1 Tax=Shouchella lehensis G1 TaxID=1246626 RepID=A0A060M1U5_9BACI|nr:bis(5'-nucleosyl)-tetraphosphatase (symmetrical) YqeK [Shouchella lehensis]AIC94029.1 hypothetical protein BleG1_1446 [Shouchella lehensis G1]RQW19948.1 HD domain-containing protein [Bacillus sp. C1-1]
MTVTLTEAWNIVRRHLPEKRFKHTVGVRDTAIRLAKHYYVDEKKAELAAIVHDLCKYFDTDEMKQGLATVGENHWAACGSELLHAPYGAMYVEKELGIKDNEVLQAIRSHTTGRAAMSPLEQVIFVADYIEPNRSFVGVDQARKYATVSLDTACLFSLTNTIQYLLSKRSPIHPYTVEAYNYYTLKGEHKD